MVWWWLHEKVGLPAQILPYFECFLFGIDLEIWKILLLQYKIILPDELAETECEIKSSLNCTRLQMLWYPNMII